MSGRRLAAVVTVQEYRDGTIADLEGSFRDGSELCHVLRNSGFLAEHIHQQDDDDVVDALEEMVAGLGEGDLFLFYFAGHGFSPEGTNEHLLLGPDAKLSRIERGFPRHAIRLSYLDDIFTRPGLDRMFVLDACRTHVHKGRGGGASLRTEAHLRDIGNRQQNAAGSYAVLNSCSKGEQACELPKRKQGLFTAALTDVLQDSHKTGKGLRADTALKDVLSARMRDLALEEGLSGSQHPAFRAGGPGTIVLLDDSSFASEPEWTADRSARPVGESDSGASIHGVRILRKPTLRISTKPSGAVITIDGHECGNSPLLMKHLDSGIYSIRVDLLGYLPWEEDVEYVGNPGEAHLQIELERDASYEMYSGSQFIRKLSDSIIIDCDTDLEWYIGPDKNTSYHDAKNWLTGLNNEWRLPTANEVRHLYESGIKSNSWGPFENTGRAVWLDETDRQRKSRRCIFDFNGGHIHWIKLDYSALSKRVFAVRLQKRRNSI